MIKIGLAPARAALYAKIDQRVQTMIALGWMEEVRRLIARGVPSSAKPFQFIGYAQIREHLEGKLSLAAAIAQIQQATRQFSKRPDDLVSQRAEGALAGGLWRRPARGRCGPCPQLA